MLVIQDILALSGVVVATFLVGGVVLAAAFYLCRPPREDPPQFAEPEEVHRPPPPEEVEDAIERARQIRQHADEIERRMRCLQQQLDVRDRRERNNA